MRLKAKIKRIIPPFIYNNILLTFPFLYRTKFISYESNCRYITELLKHLDNTLNLDGEIIECGSSRCGTSIIMARYLKAKNITKKIYACDSYEGFDLEELRREKVLGLTRAPDSSFRSTSYDYVKKKITKLECQNVILPIRGFFKHTLHKLNYEFCFAFIDCDLTESTLYCAETIWPKLKSRACIVFDDYTGGDFKGARIAIDLFIEKYNSGILSQGQARNLYFIYKK